MNLTTYNERWFSLIYGRFYSFLTPPIFEGILKSPREWVFNESPLEFLTVGFEPTPKTSQGLVLSNLRYVGVGNFFPIIYLYNQYNQNYGYKEPITRKGIIRMPFQLFDEDHLVTNPRFIIERDNSSVRNWTRITSVRGKWPNH